MRRCRQRSSGLRNRLEMRATLCTTCLLLALSSVFCLGAQTAAPAGPPAVQGGPGAAAPEQTPSTAAVAASNADPSKPVRGSDRRRAAKAYLAATRLFEKGQYEGALSGYEQAARLDPTNPDYSLAAGVARSHAVTAFVQAAAKNRLRGDSAATREALARALELDPGNALVNEHLNELGSDALAGMAKPRYEQGAEIAGSGGELAPTAGVHSFHLRSDRRLLIKEVFKGYGIETTVDDSVRAIQGRLDIDDAGFEAAVRTIGLLTKTFYVPMDPHRALVALDTRENRERFQRMEMETVYLSGLSSTELTDIGNLAKNVFDIPQSMVEPSKGTITLRAQSQTLNAFNTTMRQLLDGRSQVMLDVRLIQLAHIGGHKTGAQLPQSTTAFNVYSEEQAILNQNAALVQQIISSGLAAPGDTLAILGILLASGQVSSSLFSNGVALFGGGLTQSALAPGSTRLDLSLNSSDSRELDQIQLHLGDGEAAILRSGTRYPIQTSSFSSIAGSIPNIPGLTGAGNSSALGGLLSSLSGGFANVPQIEYQDLGLTLKATPKVMRDNMVALTIDMKIDALAGSSINGNPVLNNRAFSGVVTLKQGEAVVVASELDKQESRAVSGEPGISEIPGLNNVSSKNVQKNYASLLIIITPHVIRGTQAAGHSPMLRVERWQITH